MKGIYLGLAIASIAPLQAATADSQDHWHQICALAASKQLPSEDRLSTEEAKSLEGCSSVELYFGIGVAADPVKARKCAYLELDHGDELIWGGSTMLITIYANGRGASRNLDAAILLACKNGLEPGGGQSYRVEHLAKLRDQHWTGENFSICDDTTSGYWQGNCAWLKERIAGAKRDRKLWELTTTWSDHERRALVTLKKAFDEFVKARTENEVDLSGTARAAMQWEEETSLREAFLKEVKAVDRNTAPAATESQFEAADKSLNASYQQIETNAKFEYGTVTRSGIKETQRAWLKYRDAWVRFGREKSPNVSAETWKTLLTNERVKMLKDFLSLQ